MEWYIKIDGETITEFVDANHPNVDPLKYDEIVKTDSLVDLGGHYIYKFVDKKLVKLDECEIENHPNTLRSKMIRILETKAFILKEKYGWNELGKNKDLADAEKKYIINRKSEIDALLEKVV